MGLSAIQWTDVTDNIIVAVDDDGNQHGWWCRKISPGCTNCYAAELNQSTYFHGNKLPYTGDAPTLMLREDIIDSWIRQRKPMKHFVASMTDVFGEWVPQSWIFRFLDGMRAARRQTFQVLTKRAANMRVHVLAWLAARGLDRVPSNIWLGVSVENQPCADERILELLRIPANRWLSVEPLVGPVNLAFCARHVLDGDESNPGYVNAFSGMSYHPLTVVTVPPTHGTSAGIGWVVVGCESGNRKKIRRGFVSHVEAIVAQCAAAVVPVFVKQIGARPTVAYYYEDDAFRERALDRPHFVIESDGSKWTGDHQPDPGSLIEFRPKHRKGGDPQEWPESLRLRQFPKEMLHAS